MIDVLDKCSLDIHSVLPNSIEHIKKIIQDEQFIPNFITFVKKDKNEHSIDGRIVTFFQDKLHLVFENNQKLITKRPDFTNSWCIMDYKYSKNFSNESEKKYMETTAKIYRNEYIKKRGHVPERFFIVSDKVIHEYEFDIEKNMYKLPPKEKIFNEDSFAGLCYMLMNHNNETDIDFNNDFGFDSEFFSTSFAIIKTFYENHPDITATYYEIWSRYRKNVYDTNTKVEVYLRESWLSTLIYIILLRNYYTSTIPPSDFSYLLQSFSLRHTSLFHRDFYYWILQCLPDLCLNIFLKIFSKTFDSEDLFAQIYKEFNNRWVNEKKNSFGEVFTPKTMCDFIVKNYSEYMGKTIIDPSCGSGNFLIAWVKYIWSTHHTFDEKINAINNLYGIDINPSAVLMTKCNLSILYRSLEIDSKYWRFNIFMSNSLIPFNRTISTNNVSIPVIYVNLYGLSDIDIPISLLNSFQSYNKSITYLHAFISSYNDLHSSIPSILSFLNQIKQECNIESDDSVITLIDCFLKKIFENYDSPKINLLIYLLCNIISILYLEHKGDLIIGNPPWVIYRKLEYLYQEKIVSLIQKHDIMPQRLLLTGFDISNLFIFVCASRFLHNSGRVVFLLPQNILNSKSAEKVRNFKVFKHIEFWLFQDRIFPISHLLFDGMKNSIDISKSIYPCPMYEVLLQSSNTYNKQNIENYQPITSNQAITDTLRPISICRRIHSFLHKSPYYDKVKVGITIHPVIFFLPYAFSDYDNTTKIMQFDNTYSMRSNSDNYEKNFCQSAIYEEVKNIGIRIEKEHIYQYLDIKKFNNAFKLPEFREIFLPLDHNMKNHLQPFAHRWYNALNQIWKKQNPTKSLIEKLLYRSNISMDYKYKVIYPKSGNLIATIIPGSIITDIKIYYYETNNNNEAYYLCGILNSELIQNINEIIKNERDNTRKPFEIKIPSYQQLPDQKKIAEIAQSLQTIDDPNIYLQKITILNKTVISLFESCLNITISSELFENNSCAIDSDIQDNDNCSNISLQLSKNPVHIKGTLNFFLKNK